MLGLPTSSNHSSFWILLLLLLSMNSTTFVPLPDISHKRKRQAPWESDHESMNRACPRGPVCQHLHKLGAVNASPCLSLASGDRYWEQLTLLMPMVWWLHLNTFSQNSFVSLSQETNMELACRRTTTPSFLIENEMERV